MTEKLRCIFWDCCCRPCDCKEPFTARLLDVTPDCFAREVVEPEPTMYIPTIMTLREGGKIRPGYAGQYVPLADYERLQGNLHTETEMMLGIKEAGDILRRERDDVRERLNRALESAVELANELARTVDDRRELLRERDKLRDNLEVMIRTCAQLGKLAREAQAGRVMVGGEVGE